MLAIAESGEHAPFELRARQRLAGLYASTGRMPEARSHLARCREIVSAGEDWRGLTAEEERTETGVAAAEGGSKQADAHFERAIVIFRSYALIR